MAKAMQLPCHTIPVAKNPRYFIRSELLDTVRNALDPKAGEAQPRSLTFWGKPGIGKTQLALAYAHECREKGVPGVFWINAEGSLEISQGFTAIAVALGLEGIKANEALEKNTLIVLSWLQKTGMPCGRLVVMQMLNSHRDSMASGV